MANSAYPFEPGFGSGLPERIGHEAPNPMELQAEVFAQLLQEAAVQRTPSPIVEVTPIFGGGDVIGTSYVDQSGTNRSFTFDLS